MSIASLLIPIEKRDVEHMFLNDEEIANLVAGHENDPSIGDPEEEKPAHFTRAEKLKDFTDNSSGSCGAPSTLSAT